jgi:hypothetical protein
VDSPHSGDWELAGFIDRLDMWELAEQPSEDLSVIVTDWVFTRYDDPYRGARREPDFENLWLSVIPDSDDGSGRVVVVSFWIHESTHVVVCNGIATLSLPL